MVKIRRFKRQTAATTKAPNTFSGIRYNPTDFSRASDAIAKFGQTTQNVGLNLLQQEESNKARLAEVKSSQDLKMYETLEKQKTDLEVLKLKNARTTKMHLYMDIAFNGTVDEPGLKKIAMDFTHDPDWENNEKNFNQIVQNRKKELMASIDDGVLRSEFFIKFDNKVDALNLNVMNGSFKTKVQQLTSAYESEHKELLYEMEYGNHLEQKQAKDRLLGLNGVIGLHEEAFENGIINITPELAAQYSQGEVEFIQAKLMIADDPQAYLDLSKSEEKSKYPFKNLSLTQRAELDIKAQNDVDKITSQTAAANEKLIKNNQKIVTEITNSLDDGIIPENGITELGAARAVATELGDTETVKKIDDYFTMWATYQNASQSNLTTIDAEITKVQEAINRTNTTKLQDAPPGEEKTSGVATVDLLKLKALKTVRTKMETALNKDSLQWANQVGKITLEPMNLSMSADEWKTWVSNRRGDATQTSAIYNTKMDFLTKPEQQMIMNYWQDDATSTDDKIQLIAMLSEFDVDADNVFEEILSKGDGKKESHYFAHIAGLMNAHPDNPIIGELAADFFNGFAKKDDFSNLATEKLFGEDSNEYRRTAQKTITDKLDGSFLNADPSINSTIFNMANMIYLHRADPKDRSFNKDLYSNIVNELIGGTTIGGVDHGGVAVFNKQATYAPSWMQTDSFEEIITGLTDDEWIKASGDQVPKWYNGENTGEFKLNGDVFNRGKKGKQPYLWVVGEGRYIVSFNTPFDSQDPQYIASPTSENGYFILDLNLIKDEILAKYK
jgi:hypothetical protein